MPRAYCPVAVLHKVMDVLLVGHKARKARPEGEGKASEQHKQAKKKTINNPPH